MINGKDTWLIAIHSIPYANLVLISHVFGTCFATEKGKIEKTTQNGFTEAGTLKKPASVN